MNTIDPLYVFAGLGALTIITMTGYFVEFDWGDGKRLRIGPGKRRRKPPE